jgi:DNA primase
VSLPGGASQRDFGDALVPLRDRDVVLIPDSDQPGSLLMKYVAAALTVVGVARIRVLQMLPSDHDLSDLLNADADADPRGAQAALLAMIDAADTLWP